MLIPDLPQEYQDLLPPKEKRRRPDSDDIDMAMLWREHFPGHDFWQACHKAKTVDDLPKVPKPLKEGFKILPKDGKRHIASMVIDGKVKYISFDVGSMNNCGMTLFKGFNFPSKTVPEDYKYEIREFYRRAAQNYPFALATHNYVYADWFFCWEKIDEFVNPNSGNDVQVWKFDKKAEM